VIAEYSRYVCAARRVRGDQIQNHFTRHSGEGWDPLGLKGKLDSGFRRNDGRGFKLRQYF